MTAPVVRLAALVHELARARAAASPAPRALPFLGLEHASGTGFHLLDALSTRGIFRKYELVLDLGAGLGGTSRWLAMRLGCEVVGTTATPAEAVAGSMLTRRARLATQVRLVPAVPGALPFRSGRFTHAWILETLPRVPGPVAALAEAFRLVRGGGTLAVQDLVVADGATPAIPGWRPVSLAERVAQLEGAGFVEIEVRDRTSEATERSAHVLAARAELARRARTDQALAEIVADREALAAAVASGALGVVQMLARRP